MPAATDGSPLDELTRYPTMRAAVSDGRRHFLRSKNQYWKWPVPDLSHFDESGASRMVDVGSKPVSARSAIASGLVVMRPDTQKLIRDKKLSKGDVFEVARLAGIMAAKKTGDLIPLCHPLSLDAVSIDFEFPDPTHLKIQSQIRVTARTGVEMEALVAVATAALTVYDMCKSVDREMQIQFVQLEEKSGGRSGHFLRNPDCCE